MERKERLNESVIMERFAAKQQFKELQEWHSCFFGFPERGV